MHQETKDDAVCALKLPAGWSIIAGPTQLMAYNQKTGVVLPLEAIAQRCTYKEAKEARPL